MGGGKVYSPTFFDGIWATMLTDIACVASTEDTTEQASFSSSKRTEVVFVKAGVSHGIAAEVV